MMVLGLFLIPEHTECSCSKTPSHRTGFVWSPYQFKKVQDKHDSKFVIILQNLIKAYHRKSGKSKYDRELTELDVGTTRNWSRMNGV